VKLWKRNGLTAHKPDAIAKLTQGVRNCHRTKYTMDQARQVRVCVSEGMKDDAISRLTGVSESMVEDIRRNRAWRETAPAGSVFVWRP
jgi:hypothetical protein